MQIRINEEKIDFTLEKERALGEVVDGIQDWLSTNGFAITGILRDKKALTLASRLEWQDDPVNEVESLDITARHPMDLAYDKLTAALQYLRLIEEEGSPESPVIIDLLQGADDVAEMIDDVLPRVGQKTFGMQFKELAAETGILSDSPTSDDAFRQFLGYSSELSLVLASRMKEISDPAAEIKALAPVLKNLLGDVGNVAVWLQTGKDRDAMNHLIKLIEVLQKLIRVVHYLGEQALLDLGIMEIEGGGISDFTSGLNAFLHELSGAMENGDSVAIGDLLEYEIEPKLSGFLSALEQHGVL